jgi:hypothetical protein
MNEEYARIWKEAVAMYFSVPALPLHLFRDFGLGFLKG